MWKSIGVGPSTPFARLEKLIFLVFLGWSHIYYIYIYIHIFSHIALRLWKLDRVSRFNSVRSYRLDRTIRSFGSTRFDSAPSVESDREIAFPIEVCIYDLTIRAANLLPTSIGVFLHYYLQGSVSMIEFSVVRMCFVLVLELDCPSIDSCFIVTPTRVSVTVWTRGFFSGLVGWMILEGTKNQRHLMNIHDRYVSNFRRMRKDEKYLFLYNEVEQDFVDFFFFFNDLLLYMVGTNLKNLI